MNTAVCYSRDLSTEADNIYYIILYYIILYYIAGFVADINIAQHSSRVFEDLLHILFKFPLSSFLFIFSFNFLLLFFFRTAPNDVVACFSFLYTTERAEFVQISATTSKDFTAELIYKKQSKRKKRNVMYKNFR